LVINGLAFSLLGFHPKVLWHIQSSCSFLYHESLEKLHPYILLILFSGPVQLQFPLFQLFQRVRPLFHLLNGASIVHHHKRHGITILLGCLLLEFSRQLILHFLFQSIPLLLLLSFCCALWSILLYIANLWPFLVRLGYFYYLNHLLLI